MGLRARLTFAFTVFAVLGIGAIGAALLARSWASAMQVIADRQALIAESRAHFIGDELASLKTELWRLSRLAEVDLADNDLEPEKRVLRIARKDSALFSMTVAVVDAQGQVLWADPAPPQVNVPLKELVRRSAEDRLPHAYLAEGLMVVAAAMKNGNGAMVGIVEATRQNFFGDAIRLHLGKSGFARLRDSGGAIIARVGSLPVALGEAAAGQRWTLDPSRRRWLHTVAPVGVFGLSLELAEAADELDDELARPFRNLAAILVLGLLLAVAAGLLLARSLGRLEVVQAELFQSQHLAAMGRTAAAIAHELKNALNGVSVAVDLLISGSAPPLVAAGVRAQLREEIGRLRGVTDDLTFFAGTVRLARAKTDLHELLRRSLAILGDRVEEEQVAVDLELASSGAPLPLEVDGPKMLGVFINLGQNALDAMTPAAFGDPVDAPPVERKRKLRVTTRMLADRVEVELTDNGAGIATEAHNRIFEPFFTTKRTGTGLGLAIAKKVVEAHGGEIAAANAPGGGATFRLSLPRARP